MKKGQIVTISIILIILVLILGFVTVWLVINQNPQNTGQAIKENQPVQKTIICNAPYIQVGDNCCLDKNDNQICDNDENNIFENTAEVITGRAYLSSPFYINAWNVKASSGVSIELKNNGGEDYVISEVDISGCNSVKTSTSIQMDDVASIIVPCTLSVGTTFKGDITISYRKVQSQIVLTSTGTISEKVSA